MQRAASGSKIIEKQGVFHGESALSASSQEGKIEDDDHAEYDTVDTEYFKVMFSDVTQKHADGKNGYDKGDKGSD